MQAARQAINPTPRQGPAYSLLIAAPDYDESTIGDDWLAGVQWLPDACPLGAAGRLAVDCVGDTTIMSVPTKPAIAVSDPFLVYAADRCSSFGYQVADYIGRAGRLLDVTQSSQIAAELELGSLNPTLGNTPLTDSSSDTLTAAALAPDAALARIEGGIAHYGLGLRGMVHVTAQVLTELVTNGSIYRSGNLWLTAMGNIVVADAGYTGAAPGGAAPTTSQWMYGTDMISILLGPTIYLPDVDLASSPGEFMAQALDRSTNTVTVYAQRFAAWVWDRCVHVAAEVNVAVPAFGAP